MRSTSATIIWRNWSSPDSYSSNRNVFVPLAADTVQALIKTYCDLHGFNGRSFGPTDPQRGWWPDSPPQPFRTAFVKLANATIPDDPQHAEIVQTMAKGEWLYFTSVPAKLQDAMRALAVETPSSQQVKVCEHGLGDGWGGFFRFLARLGVEVKQLPGRSSACDPSVHQSEASGVMDLLSCANIVRINVGESPLPDKK